MSHDGIMGLAPEVMISPQTLNSWLTMGYGVDTFGYYRLVILAVDSREGYHQGHVPGAYLLEVGPEDLWAARSNGISVNAFQVPTRAQMDRIIQRTNIDSDSVIVITGSSMTSISRAYFNFRYWGFPRQQLKVLNGTSSTYATAGFPLQTQSPSAPEPCQYSVCDTRGLSSFSAVRASFAEMLSVAEEKGTEKTIIDTRSPAEYAGKPGSTALHPDINEYVAFEGHVKRAVNLNYKNLLVDGSNTKPLLAREDLQELMNKHSITDSKISFVYGNDGREDAVLFLVLDAEFNWPVKIYDGGWSQWGQMAGNSPEIGGILQEDSPWKTDNPRRSEAISYNKSSGFPVATAGSANSYAKQGDAVNRSDLEICGKTGANLKTVPIAPGY